MQNYQGVIDRQIGKKWSDLSKSNEVESWRLELSEFSRNFWRVRIETGWDEKKRWILVRSENELLPILAASVATVRPKVSAILTMFACSAHCFRWKVKVPFSAQSVSVSLFCEWVRLFGLDFTNRQTYILLFPLSIHCPQVRVMNFFTLSFEATDLCKSPNE